MEALLLRGWIVVSGDELVQLLNIYNGQTTSK